MDQFTPKPQSNTEKESQIFHDLFSLSIEERQTLSERIRKSKGVVRIMVHPYFFQQENLRKDEIPNAKVAVIDPFERILKGESSTPVFLFESFKQITSTKERLLPILQKSGNEVYFVPTIPSASYVYTGDINDIKSGDIHLIKVMKELGIKKVIIGGIEFFVGKIYHTDDEEEVKGGCAAGLILTLENDFEIQASHLGYPHSRRDMQRPDRKPTDKI